MEATKEMVESIIQKSILEKKDLIQFMKKIRTIFINGKTLSDLQEALHLMLENDTDKIQVDGITKSRYKLGDILYLVDIRYDTYYKSKRTIPDNKEQWFGPNNLEQLFKKNTQIRYRYCQALGNPPKIRKAYSITKKMNEEEKKKVKEKQKELYLQYLHSNHKKYNTKTEFEKLFGIANNKRPLYQICLMCYCQPKKGACHRFWLREALLHKYYEINDLGHAPLLDHYYTIDNKIN